MGAIAWLPVRYSNISNIGIILSNILIERTNQFPIHDIFNEKNSREMARHCRGRVSRKTVATGEERDIDEVC